MKKKLRMFLLVIFLFSCSKPNPWGISEEYLPYIPTVFKDDLKLEEVTNKADDEFKGRNVDFYDFTKDPIVKTGTKKISVKSGYRAMYAYPDTDYFANVKMEKSMPGQFEADKTTATEFLRNYCSTKNAIADRLAKTDLNNLPENLKKALSKPEEMKKFKETVQQLKSKDGKAIVFHEGQYKGYSYVKCTEEILPVVADTSKDIIQIYIPKEKIIISAFLLFQNNAKFKTIEEFKILDQMFLEGFIDYIEKLDG